jgi:hypothetical protein
LSDHRALRAYFEAGQYMASLSSTLELPVSIFVTFMGAAMWTNRRDHVDGPMPLEELAARTGKTPSSISSHLRYLGNRYRDDKPGLGLVRTYEHPLNGRMKTFQLTPKGEAVAEHLRYLHGRD